MNAFFRLFLCAGAISLASTGHEATAQTVEEFYKGKTITLTVGTAAGAGGDTYARLIAPFLTKHLPGNPVVVVENIPAAGGIVHMNQTYEQAERDGTVIGLTREAVPFEPILLGERSKGKFDLSKINWLSSPNSFPNVAFAWHTAPVKTAQDLKKHELIVGGIGQTGSSNDAVVLNNLLGFKYRVINGYPGPSEIDLAVETGELQGRASAGWTGLSTRHSNWLEEKLINILYHTGETRYPQIPESVPSIYDLAETEEQKAILKLKYGSNEVGFPFFAPPDVPQDRLDALRAAFDATYADPEFQAAAKAQRVDVYPVDYKRMEQVYAQAYSAPAELLQKLEELSKPPAN